MSRQDPLEPTGRTVRLPTAALFSKHLERDAERFRAFVQLVATTTPRAGVRSVKGRPVRLRAGQIVASHGDLGELWGMSRHAARRHLEAFARDGLVTLAPVDQSVAVDGWDPPDGTLVTVLGLRDDPKG